MSIQHVNAVANRLSLRPPQRESLKILDRLCEIVDFQKSTDPAEAYREAYYRRFEALMKQAGELAQGDGR